MKETSGRGGYKKSGGTGKNMWKRWRLDGRKERGEQGGNGRSNAMGEGSIRYRVDKEYIRYKERCGRGRNRRERKGSTGEYKWEDKGKIRNR